VQKWVVLIACGLISFGVVSWLLSRVRPRRSTAFFSPEQSWPEVLQVSQDAGAAEIETAYHARLAECEQVRLAPDSTAQDRKDAEARRAQIVMAYEFIRPRRQSPPP